MDKKQEDIQPMVENETMPVTEPETALKAEVRYAGFWKRLAAYVIDFVVISFVFVIIGFALALMGLVDLNQEVPMEEYDNSIDLISILITWGYFALMESSSKQGTLGKMALGIKVRDYDGQRISFLRATGRFFGKYLSAILLMIGFLMIAFTARKQGLHDILARTLVVNQR
jgi:uncharacterized RDD family membrane protein YckC